MGNKNSSVTRVWPVFDQLLEKDPTGQTWLPQLVALGTGPLASELAGKDLGTLIPKVAEFSRELPGVMKKVLGPANAARIGNLRGAFEKDFAPPARFLKWMLEHPKELTWPLSGSKQTLEYGKATMEARRGLMGGDPEFLKKGLAGLAGVGSEGSKRKWWAFEGWTNVDCWLETEKIVIFIEGKRTEGISSATHWYPSRNQLVRNIEVAKEWAEPQGKQFGVILCAEFPVDMRPDAFEKSLPHFTPAEREILKSHYLGCVTWEEIRRNLCPEMILPDDLEGAVKFCATFR